MSDENTYRLQEALPILDVHAPLLELGSRRTSVLVVEDEEDQSHALSAELRRAGFRVISSLDASGGRSLAELLSFDVVLLDLALGSHDTVFLETMRSVLRSTDLPVIVLADGEALPRATDAHEGLVEGARLGAVLAKPVAASVVIATIRELVEPPAALPSRATASLPAQRAHSA